MKLVSIITPTCQRHDALLNVCIPSVQKQTYQNIEHIVVSDGRDDALRIKLYNLQLKNLTFVELGRNWRTFTGGASVGAVPRSVGTFLAQGDYIGYLDDDDEFLPTHVEDCYNCLTEHNVDWVVSKMERDWSDHRANDVIGDGSLDYGHVGTPMLFHKANLLARAHWAPMGYHEDHDFATQLLAASLKWKFLDKVTILYHKQV